jgi:phospholipid/cholesterol/gamma-HCH transport system permease protein
MKSAISHKISTINLNYLFISFELVGKSFNKFAATVGRLSFFTTEILFNIFRSPFYFKRILDQIINIGYFSLPVIAMTAIFTGAVLALQTYTGFSRFNAESTIAVVVVLSITRELGPVLAGLMVSGRVGAAIAAEIGTMKVTEQIDALKTLSTNPIQYLVVPKIIAAVISLPLLVIVSDIIGVMGGYLVSVNKLGFSSNSYLINTFDYLEFNDVMSGLIKATVFGFIIALMGCYHGYYCKQGAQGVGRATTNAVVSASILVLLSNYLLTELLFAK